MISKEMIQNIVKTVFWNSWIKSFVFFMICFAVTAWIVSHFSDVFTAFFNWRNKNFWTGLAILIPTVFLVPMFMNMFLFIKIVQIADNTQKTNKLIQQYIKNKQQPVLKSVKKQNSSLEKKNDL